VCGPLQEAQTLDQSPRSWDKGNGPADGANERAVALHADGSVSARLVAGSNLAPSGVVGPMHQSGADDGEPTAGPRYRLAWLRASRHSTTRRLLRTSLRAAHLPPTPWPVGRHRLRRDVQPQWPHGRVLTDRGEARVRLPAASDALRHMAHLNEKAPPSPKDRRKSSLRALLTGVLTRRTSDRLLRRLRHQRRPLVQWQTKPKAAPRPGFDYDTRLDWQPVPRRRGQR
jgi:hypothetical protein